MTEGLLASDPEAIRILSSLGLKCTSQLPPGVKRCGSWSCDVCGMQRTAHAMNRIFQGLMLAVFWKASGSHIVLTAPKGLGSIDYLHARWTRLQKDLNRTGHFSAWVRVTGIGVENGRPHIHLLQCFANSSLPPAEIERRAKRAGFGRTTVDGIRATPLDCERLARYCAIDALHAARRWSLPGRARPVDFARRWPGQPMSAAERGQFPSEPAHWPLVLPSETAPSPVIG